MVQIKHKTTKQVYTVTEKEWGVISENSEVGSKYTVLESGDKKAPIEKQAAEKTTEK